MNRVGKGLLITSGVLVTLGVVASAAWKISDNAAVEKVKAIAKQSRFPVTVAEMYPEPSIPKEENAFDLIPAYTEAKPKGKTVAKINDSDDVEAIRTKLEPWAPALAVMEKMTAMPKYQPHRTGANLVAVSFPEFADLKQGAQLLAARAKVRAHDGDMPGALSDLERVGTISRFLDSEHVLIGGLVKVSIEATLAKAVAELLPSADGPTSAKLLATLDRPGPFNFDHFLRGEGGFRAYAALDHLTPEMLGMENPTFETQMSFVEIRLTRASWAPEMVSDYAKCMEKIESTPFDPDVAAEALSSSTAPYEHATGAKRLVADLLLPVFSQVVESARRPTVSHALLECASKALLAKKAPDVTSTHDAFDGGKPFKLLTTQTGWKLYSLGADRKDDGCEKSKDGQLTDLCVIYDAGKMLLAGR